MNNSNANYPVNLFGLDERTSEKLILLSVTVASPEPFLDNSTIYSNLGLNGKDNANLSTILIRNID